MGTSPGQGYVCGVPRGLIAAVLLAIVFGGFSPRLLADNALTFGQPINLSGNTQGNTSQMIVDSEGNIDIAYTLQEGENGTRDLYFVRSTDNGNSFSLPLKVSIDASGWFSMALEPPCTIDFAYLDMGEPPVPPSLGVPGAVSMNFAQSTDCGADFTTTVITTATFGTLYPADIWPGLVINQGVAQVAWTGALGVYYSQRNPDGTFALPVLIGLGGAFGLQMAVSPNGHTDIAWFVPEYASQDDGVFFLDSTTGGKPINIDGSSGDGNTQLAIDAQSNVNLMWVDWPGGTPNGTIELSRSMGQSGTFAPTKALFPAIAAQMAMDGDGNIGLTWTQPQNGSYTLFFSRSTDSGSTFSTPVPITNPAPTSEFSQRFVLNGNSIYILWLQDSDLWYSFSSDGGNTFSAPANITNDHAPESAFGLEVSCNAQGDVFAVWIHGTPGQVYFERGTPESNFTITAAPPAQSVLPGGAANFTLTLTAAGGFSNAANLTCTNLPPGAACAFNSASITPSSSGSNVTLTITTPPTLAQANYSVTVSAASGNITQTQTVQVAVGGIISSMSPTSATIAAGSSATFAVALNSTGGFAGQLTLSCSGAPSGMACSFNPPQVTVAANSSATSTLTVNVAAPPSVSIIPRPKGNWLQTISRELPLVTAALALFAVALSFLAFSLTSLRQGRRELLLGLASFASVLVLAIGLISCGGATTAPNGGSTAASTTPSGSSGTGTTGTSGTGTSGGTGTSSGTGSSGGSSGTGAGSGSGSGGTGGSGSGSSSVTSQIIVQAQSGGATITLGTVSVTVP